MHDTWDDYGYKAFKESDLAYVGFVEEGKPSQVFLWNPSHKAILAGARQVGMNDEQIDVVFRTIREREKETNGFLFMVERFQRYVNERRTAHEQMS